MAAVAAKAAVEKKDRPGAGRRCLLLVLQDDTKELLRRLVDRIILWKHMAELKADITAIFDEENIELKDKDYSPQVDARKQVQEFVGGRREKSGRPRPRRRRRPPNGESLYSRDRRAASGGCPPQPTHAFGPDIGPGSSNPFEHLLSSPSDPQPALAV